MSDPGTSGAGFFGQLGVSSTNGRYNAIVAVIKQILGEVRTGTVVQVNAVHGGGLAPVGTVDVTPLIHMVDGVLNVAPHGIVHGLPYFRLQGGANAIICDPVVGDIGFAVMSDRDASVVKATKKAGAPGSRRQFSLSDGFYIGGFLNAVPTQYWQFTADGMSAADKSGNTITMASAGITINGVLIDRSGNISGAGTMQASGEGTFNGHSVGEHIHGGVQTGSGNTGLPTG